VIGLCYNRVLQRRHQEFGRTVREFWRALQKQDIKFSELVRAFKQIERAQSDAHQTFRIALERHPMSVQVLRSYAAFLEDAMNDPHRASHHYKYGTCPLRGTRAAHHHISHEPAPASRGSWALS
jgi:Tfp pilus assembly protein PilF